ncbi:ABC transporter ATP-binding protein [Enterobacter hormaechei]
MINAEGLTFGFKGQPAIFENISFRLRQGEVLCVLGPNGAGKTTLLKIVAGILRPVSGRCIIENDDGRKVRLAWVPQTRHTPFDYSVLDFITFGLGGRNGYLAAPGSDDYIRAESVLVRLGAGYLRDKHVNQISGGELQLCAIAKALVSEPDVLILDEPESGLDLKFQYRIISLLHELATCEQKTIIMNTHFIRHARQVADLCLLLRRGYYACGQTDSMLDDYLLSLYFGVSIRTSTGPAF